MKLKTKPKKNLSKQAPIFEKDIKLANDIEMEMKKFDSSIYGPESKILKYFFIIMLIAQIALIATLIKVFI